ncbi:MAG: hypothetical protein IKK24_00270, partial [Clostridia bacterium]|nr:hypothetical protein [Clostridia bacterium]
VTYGDADENDKVEANDLVVLKKVLLDAADENKSCDANNDKDVNILDFILLKKYLAGEDVKLGGSSGNISGDIEWN